MLGGKADIDQRPTMSVPDPKRISGCRSPRNHHARTVIRRIGTLSVYGRAVVDRVVCDHRWKICPTAFRRPGIAQRRRHRIDNHFLLFRGEIALADTAGGGRWRWLRLCMFDQDASPKHDYASAD